MGVREGTREKQLEKEEKTESSTPNDSTVTVTGDSKNTTEVEKIKVTEYYIKFKNL